MSSSVAIETSPAPQGASSSTLWVWLIVALPIVTSLVGIGLFADMQRIFPAIIELMREEFAKAEQGSGDPAMTGRMIDLILAIIYSPWLWLTLTLGWGGWAASIRFAVLDSRALEAKGYSAFPWVWAILSPVVYVVGRRVRLRRQGGSGRAPVVVSVVTQSLALVVAVTWGAALNVQMLSFILSEMPTP